MTATYTPARTCIGCRERAPWETLARLIVQEDVASAQPFVRVDTRHRLPGRGAWIHPTAQCWNKALKKNAFARAFRRPVKPSEIPPEFSITESG